MGEPWKMPTKDQYQELIDNTYSEWTSINGVNGKKFTSKTDSSKYIFLPAGGYWWVPNIASIHTKAESSGRYWATEIRDYITSSPFCLSFDSSNLTIYDSPRSHGISIRSTSTKRLLD